MQKLISVLITTALSGCLIEGTSVDLGERDIALTVLHTSDIHSRILPYTYDPPAPIEAHGLKLENAPFGGAARLATLVKRERERSSRVIHLDSGDMFQGAPVFNRFSGEPEVRVLSEIGIDAFSIGNHDFDLGATNVMAQYDTWASFPILAANWWPDRPDVAGNQQLADLVSPVTVIDLRGLRVLVVGLGNRSSMTSLGEGGNSVGVTPLESHETMQGYINMWAPPRRSDHRPLPPRAQRGPRAGPRYLPLRAGERAARDQRLRRHRGGGAQALPGHGGAGAGPRVWRPPPHDPGSTGAA